MILGNCVVDYGFGKCGFGIYIYTVVKGEYLLKLFIPEK